MHIQNTDEESVFYPLVPYPKIFVKASKTHSWWSEILFKVSKSATVAEICC